jgi:hypothetical protein
MVHPWGKFPKTTVQKEMNEFPFLFSLPLLRSHFGNSLKMEVGNKRRGIPKGDSGKSGKGGCPQEALLPVGNSPLWWK